MVISIKQSSLPREYDFKEHFPFSKKVSVSLPTIIDRKIGAELIEVLTLLGMEWEMVLRPNFQPPSAWKTFCPTGYASEDRYSDVESDVTLMDLYEEAVTEASDYFDSYGMIDANWLDDNGNMLFRKAQIGDDVQLLRTSKDELDLLYGEPKEERPSSGLIIRKTLLVTVTGTVKGHNIELPPYDFDSSRWDGDARFVAQQTEISTDKVEIDLHDPETRRWFYGIEIETRKIKPKI